MAAAAADFKEACLVVAMCVVALLHSSMGQQPPPSPESYGPYTGQPPLPSPPPTSATSPPSPGSPCPYELGQNPPPPPPLTPAPTATPPAPAPVVCSWSNCGSQCSPVCEGNRVANAEKCHSDFVASFNECYANCTSHACPGKSCVHSGCGVGNCSCDNPNASGCCKQCDSSLSPGYKGCLDFTYRYEQYCQSNCQESCYRNCTQGA